MTESYRPDILKKVSWGICQGMSQKEMAKEYDLNKNTVSKYGNRIRDMNENQVIGLLKKVIKENEG